MTDFLQEYAAHCAEHGRPDRVELMLCDINAVLRGIARREERRA